MSLKSRGEWNLPKEKKINDILVDQLKKFSYDYELLFITGNNYYKDFKNLKVNDNVKIVPYIDNFTSLLKSADLLVSRAGATTLSEIIAINIPSILIPSPYVTENHQYKNAMTLVNNGAAILLQENNLEGIDLGKYINDILNDGKIINNLKKNLTKMQIKTSASNIYDEIIKTIKEKSNERSN